MKRELKHEDLRTARIEMHDIAEPIPMKRELKLYAFGGVRCKVVQNCRAYPDEKGIETFVYILPTEITHKIAEPIPMKRELKHILSRRQTWPRVVRDCRAYPDEKGIETPNCKCECSFIFDLIAEPIPMKRELKRFTSARATRSVLSDCRAYPDEKGIETPMSPGRGSHVTDGKPDILIRPC